MSKIAFIGLGAMGSRMAGHLVTAKHEVRVWNRSPGPVDALVGQGATAAASPREAAEGAEAVITMVTDDRASRAVWLEGDDAAIRGLGEGALAIESSTVTPGWVQELRQEVQSVGAHMVDAPLAGSLPQAEAKALIYFVGASPDAAERARLILAEMGGAIHHVGEAGNGALIKLAVNALFATQVEVLGELLGMLKKAGIAPDAAMSVLGEVPVTSPAAKGVGGLIAAEKYAPLFPVDLVAKDMGYAVATAASVNSESPVLSAVHQTYERARGAGHGGLNIQGVAKLFL